MTDDLDLRVLQQSVEPDAAFRVSLRARVIEVLEHPSAATAGDGLDKEAITVMLTDERPADQRPPSRFTRWPAVAAAGALVAGAIIGGAVLLDDDDDRAPRAAGTAVFDDTFDDQRGQWPDESGATVDGGKLTWRMEQPGQREFLRPLAVTDRLVDTEVSAEIASIDDDSTVAVYCRKGAGDQDQYYFFRLRPEGATIGVLPVEPDEPARTLASDADFRRPSAPFSLTARCVDHDGVTSLTMLIDGTQLLAGTDTHPLPSGFGAVELEAGAPGAAPSELTLERFTISSLD